MSLDYNNLALNIILFEMAKVKASIRVPSVELKYDSENVQNRVETFYSGKDIRSELYHLLDLNGDKKTKLEKLSHYNMAAGLHNEVNNIEAFFSSNRTFNSCNRGDFDHLWGSILISMFTSYKETYMAEKGYSWENWLSQIVNEDLASLNVSSRVNIINGPADKLNSDQRIIGEIRNALDHTNYVVQGRTVHVRNPQTGFEAKVPLDFLYDFISLVQRKSRRDPMMGIDTDDKSIYIYPNNFKFDDVKDKIRYSISVNSTKDNPAHVRNFEEYKKLLQSYKNGAVESDRKDKEIKLTSKLEELARTYFNENGKTRKRKGHRIDYKNLKYVYKNSVYPPENFMWELLKSIKINVQNNNCKFYSSDFVDEFGISMTDASCFGDPAFRRGESDPEIAELVEFEKALRGEKLPDGQSILKQLNACTDFAVQYFLKRGYKPILKVENGEQVCYFKLGLTEIKTRNIDDVCGALNSYYFMGRQFAESFPDWLKIQYIKSVYVNELVSLGTDYVPGLIGSGTKDPNDKFTNRDHVRNALVHNNYVMLHGVDEIVLRDGYNRKTDTWAREETISLPTLYEETYREMVSNMVNEPGVELKIHDEHNVE